jgi:hypothetical protein
MADAVEETLTDAPVGGIVLGFLIEGVEHPDGPAGARRPISACGVGDGEQGGPTFSEAVAYVVGPVGPRPAQLVGPGARPTCQPSPKCFARRYGIPRHKLLDVLVWLAALHLDGDRAR